MYWPTDQNTFVEKKIFKNYIIIETCKDLGLHIRCRLPPPLVKLKYRNSTHSKLNNKRTDSETNFVQRWKNAV